MTANSSLVSWKVGYSTPNPKSGRTGTSCTSVNHAYLCLWYFYFTCDSDVGGVYTWQLVGGVCMWQWCGWSLYVTVSGRSLYVTVVLGGVYIMWQWCEQSLCDSDVGGVYTGQWCGRSLYWTVMWAESILDSEFCKSARDHILTSHNWPL